jgi:tetrahedral aminopeptidase
VGTSEQNNESVAQNPNQCLVVEKRIGNCFSSPTDKKTEVPLLEGSDARNLACEEEPLRQSAKRPAEPETSPPLLQVFPGKRDPRWFDNSFFQAKALLEEVGMGKDVDGAGEPKKIAKPARVVPVVVAHDNGVAGSEVDAEFAGVAKERRSLPRIKEKIPRVAFDKNGPAMLGDEPPSVIDTVFADDGEFHRFFSGFCSAHGLCVEENFTTERTEAVVNQPFFFLGGSPLQYDVRDGVPDGAAVVPDIQNQGSPMEFLKKLCETHGISGREEAVRALIREEMKGRVDEISVDALGSITCFRKGTGRAPRRKVMLSGHIDEIGFIVNCVEKDGWIRFLPVGGWDTRNLISQRVFVHTRSGKRIRGVIGSKPIHVLTAEERRKQLDFADLYIDTGLPKSRVTKVVSEGDWVTMDRDFVVMGDCYVAKAFDDRVGAAVIFEAVKAVKNHKVDIYAVGSVQEEVGLRGAHVSAFDIRPDIAVAVDITLACDTPGSRTHQRVTTLGGGVAIKIMDSSLICSPRLVDFFIDIAKKNRIRYQMEILRRGGTDAGAMQRVHSGCPAITISIPTRYGHSPIEMVHKKDVAAATRLITKFLEAAHKGDFLPH